ncbi:MAG: hypothetical protein BJ554DRAFT_5293 [Olpidium bornovanus]|uniref:Dolichyldiphosphatase n=1 Tax=Olpidium bornovanus TaxID=278681 RepID=A0A8H7ZZQ2_9FUNG|nr:MAG: hypothetical protein BJ554DRAFT_5293 [Olpidium bornovanus]
MLRQEPYPPSAPLTSLSITHVQFHPSDPVAQQLAYATLAPLAIIVAYVSLFVARREVSVLFMFAGQLLCELVNAALKRLLKEKRPTGATRAPAVLTFLLLLPIALQKKRVTFQQRVWKLVIGPALIASAVVVAVYLSYHSAEQVLVGGALGAALAVAWYLFVDVRIRKSPAFHKFLGSSLARYCYIQYVALQKKKKKKIRKRNLLEGPFRFCNPAVSNGRGRASDNSTTQ